MSDHLWNQMYECDPRPDPAEYVAPDCWRTKDGRLLKIVDMDDQHLRNALAMMERQIARERGSSACGDCDDLEAAEDKVVRLRAELTLRDLRAEVVRLRETLDGVNNLLHYLGSHDMDIAERVAPYRMQIRALLGKK